MKYRLSTSLILLLFVSNMFAQELETTPEYTLPVHKETMASQYLFSETAFNTEENHWEVNYLSGFGQNDATSFNYNGVTQQVAVKGYLGHQITFFANAAIGIAAESNKVANAQRIEAARSVIGGKNKFGLHAGIGLGVSRDYDNVKSIVSRTILSFNTPLWSVDGNLLVEHPFQKGRDNMDVLTSIGFHYSILKNLRAGCEAVGEDLEGLWDDEEAEGGAKIYVGPSLHYKPQSTSFSFSLSAGPVLYATKDRQTSFGAIRDLPDKNGLIARIKVSYKFF